MTMKILQIGYLNWASQVEKLPEDLEWFFCEPENIQNFLKLEEERLLAEVLKNMMKQDKLIEKPKVHIQFNAIVITDYLEEKQLEPLMDTIEAYSLFCGAELNLSSDSPNGIFRRKILRKLEKSKEISSCINFLYQVLFSSQYGAKLKIPEIDINPNFRGMVQRKGHVNTQFTGDFGEDFQQLFTYRYNLSSFPVALELWQEYEKVKGNCHIQLVITPMRRGSLYELMDSLNAHLDVISERLITIGGEPYSTLVEFSSNSGLTETTGTFDKPMSDQIQLLVDTYKYLSVLFQVGLDITDEEGDAPSNDIFTAAKSEIDKTIWMLTAELGQAPGLK